MAIGILPVRPVDAYIQGGGGGGSSDVAAALFRSVFVEPDSVLSVDTGAAMALTLGGFLLTISPAGVEITV